MWDIIESGYTHPIKISLDGEVYLKPISEYDDKEKKRYDYNAKAMIAFFCTLNHVEFTRVKNYKMVFEIWKLMEVTHKETSQVKDYKLISLTREY